MHNTTTIKSEQHEPGFFDPNFTYNKMSLKGKKLLIIAGADVHCKLVNAAKELGVYTIVTDYLPIEKSPAKQIADEYWMINITDIDAIVEKCREENVDGVIAFCIDPAQYPYQQVCERLGVPCYGTKRQFDIMTDKRLFKDFCVENNVSVIPEYSIEDIRTGNAIYPLLVKPNITRGSRGQTICHKPEDVENAIEFAASESIDKKFLIERYFDGKDDMSFAYMVIDGEPYLLKIGDRIVGKKEDNLTRQQISTILPSKHLDDYIKIVEPRVKNMIRTLGLQFGAVFLQGFWDNQTQDVYMYDPGLRFPGGDYDIVLKDATGFDNSKAFVEFALTGNVKSCYGNPDKMYRLNGDACVILSIACRGGKIQTFNGFNEIKSNPCVFSASKRYELGDEVPETGDIRQRVAEFVAHLNGRENIADFINYVYQTIEIKDQYGRDMLVSKVNTSNDI